MANSDITISVGGVPSAAFNPRNVDRGGGVREPVHSLARQDGALIDPATAQGQASMLAALAGLALSTDVQAGTAKGEQVRALLASILSAIQAQRTETIWTDDTDTRFIRVDIGGTIVWTDVAGNASSAPGTGARPDSDSGSAVSRSSYKASANGTGFSLGDYLDHLIVADESGDLVGNFWINTSAGTKVAAPPAASLSPISPLPDGAATDAKLEAVRALLASALTVQGSVTANLGTLNGAATAAAQATGNTALGSIDGKLPAPGQKTAALSLPVVLSSDGPLATAYGTAADSATTDIAASGASFTFTSLFKGMVANLLTIRTSLAGTLAVGGNTSRPSAGFARPANTTAYVAGQLVANTTTAGSVTALALAAARKAGGTGAIPRLSLKKSTATLTAARFRVHLFRDAPVVAVGDGGTFAGNVSEAGYLGSFDVVMDRTWSDGALGLAVPNTGSAAVFAAAAGSQSIQALIEARDAYAPGSGETFTLTLDVAQD